MRELVLVINPGSTSTKVAVFNENELLFQDNIVHTTDTLEKFQSIINQKDLRKDSIIDFLKKNNISIERIRAVVGRGGLLNPIPSGTYLITLKMIEDLKNSARGEHASNLGGIIAWEIGMSNDIPSYVVDPVSVDEFENIARISGNKNIIRKSFIHALNIRSAGNTVCNKLNKKLSEVNLVVAHIGGGISVVAMKNGLIVDANNSNEMGPFTPERSGTLPAGDLVRLVYSGRYTQKELIRKINGRGGLVSYLGTNDIREVERRINQDKDLYAELILNAMIYQIAKEIGAYAAVLSGDVDAIILTGGGSNSDYIISEINKRTSFIGPIFTVPDENEMRALNDGVLRIFKGFDRVKIYEDEVISDYVGRMF